MCWFLIWMHTNLLIPGLVKQIMLYIYMDCTCIYIFIYYILTILINIIYLKGCTYIKCQIYLEIRE